MRISDGREEKGKDRLAGAVIVSKLDITVTLMSCLVEVSSELLAMLAATVRGVIFLSSWMEAVSTVGGPRFEHSVSSMSDSVMNVKGYSVWST